MLGRERGSSPETLESFLALVHEDDRQRLLDRIRAPAPRATELGEIEVRMRTLDSSYRWVHLMWRTIEASADGSVRHLVGVMTDAASGHAERAFQEDSATRLRLALAASNQGTFEVDLTTDVVRIDACLATILELEAAEREEDLGWFVDRVHPDDRSRVAEAMRVASGTARSEHTCEFRIQMSTGECRWILSRGAVVERDADGRPVRLVGTQMDVTEQRRAIHVKEELEAQLRQAQKMEPVGRLASGIAHDFNNLLSVILSYASLALDSARDSELREDLYEICRAAERGASLTRQLLAFTRKQATDIQLVDAGALVAGMETMLRRTLGDRVVVRTGAGPGVPPIRIDPVQLEQVLMNLAVNSRDAMPSGGELEIGVEVLTCPPAPRGTSLEPGSYVRIRVRDTGCGMDEETRRHAFEPFFTTKAGGTGLGLATVGGIVRDAGGAIVLDSALDVGTAFEVYFPALVGAEPTVPPAARGNSARFGTETVLVVDDDDAVRGAAVAVLRKHGYRALHANGTERALELAATIVGDVDVLVTDVVMPSGGGIELARRLTEVWPRLRVLFVSGHTEDAEVAGLAHQVPSALLAKPFAVQSLLENVRAVLDERGSIRSGTHATAAPAEVVDAEQPTDPMRRSLLPIDLVAEGGSRR
jgi:signal transduction histidine kinase/CheY-like chemotaxis protein